MATLKSITTEELPHQQNYWIVQVKATWADAWQTDFSIEALKGSASIGRAGKSIFTFQRRYGAAVKAPYETAYAARVPMDLSNHWIRVKVMSNDQLSIQGLLASLGGDNGETIFQGKIEDETANIEGDDYGQSGIQAWSAVGPERILGKIDVYQSRWRTQGASYATMDWLAGFNVRSAHDGDAALLVGNRSAAVDNSTSPITGGVYVFGGTSTWTNLQMLQYFVQHFVQQSGGPLWTIGGHVLALSTLSTRIPFTRIKETAEHIIQAIVPNQAGVDYKISPTEAGFEITLFSTVAEDGTFGGYTIPRNQRAWRSDVGGDPTIKDQAVVATSRSHQYDSVRTVGNRIQICLTFDMQPTHLTGRPLWSSALQTAYKAGAGGSDAQDNDLARSDEKYAYVYRAFGPDPDWMEINENFHAKLTGEVDPGTGAARAVDGAVLIQSVVKHTLNNLPLLANYDYRTDPPTSAGATGVQSEFLKPMGFIKDADTDRWYPVDKIKQISPAFPNISIHPLQDEWGVLLNFAPNHFLARNGWSGAQASDMDPDAAQTLDYNNLQITIAIESDYRIWLQQDVPDAARSGNGMIKVLEMPDAHYWKLAGATTLGVDGNGERIFSPEMVLRDDTARMARTLAGAVAEYLNQRVRAQITYRRIQPAHQLLGTILEAVEDGGVARAVGSVVSTIDWDFSSMETTIRTGYGL